MEGGHRKNPGNAGAASSASSSSPKRVMVVMEPTRESAAALQYTLLHGVVERDELILLQLENPSSWRNAISTFFRRSGAVGLPTSSLSSVAAGSGGGGISSPRGEGGGVTDFLEEARRACEATQPSVRVRMERVEMEGGMEKAVVILSQSKLHGVDVLIIGQRRSLSTTILGSRRQGNSMRVPRVTDTAEYLIENCSCTCVGVQRKGQNAGYLLNTKTLRNFWLLA